MPRLSRLLPHGIAILAASLAASAAQAGEKCAPRPQVIERLVSGYGETRQSIGLGGEQQVIETFAAAETGTWTIIVTLPTGMSCVIAAGEAFENVAGTVPAPGEPA